MKGSSSILVHGAEYNEGYCDALEDITNFINSLPEEPVRSVWHDASEEPRFEEKILVLRNNGTVTQVKTYQNNFFKK